MRYQKYFEFIDTITRRSVLLEFDWKVSFTHLMLVSFYFVPFFSSIESKLKLCFEEKSPSCQNSKWLDQKKKSDKNCIHLSHLNLYTVSHISHTLFDCYRSAGWFVGCVGRTRHWFEHHHLSSKNIWSHLVECIMYAKSAV